MEITFLIERCIFPKTLKDFTESTTKWVHCAIKIVKSSDPTLVLKRFNYKGRLPSCAPYFEYNTKCRWAAGGRRSRVLMPTIKNAVAEYTVRNNTKLTVKDRSFILKELKLYTSTKYTMAMLNKFEWLGNIKRGTEIYNLIDYYRLRRVLELLRFFPKQGENLRKLGLVKLNKCRSVLSDAPQMLMFRRVSKKDYGLKALSLGKFNIARNTFKIATPWMIRVAMRLYHHIKTRRSEIGDTLFSKVRQANNYLKKYFKDQSYIDPGYTYLKTNQAIEFAYDTSDEFYFHRDSEVADHICQSLQRVADGFELPQNSTEPVCVGRLTDEQLPAVEHVKTNWLTMLTGGPGTGKTEVISHIVPECKHPLIVTFVGTAVEELASRLDCPDVYTIHYVICRAQHDDNPEKWINQFDVLIVDEAANVDSRLFSRLLNATYMIKRLVLVGDVHQINPIKPGTPFKDLIELFPQHHYELTINQRVDPAARALADASIHIKNNELEKIDFNSSCVSLKDTGEVETHLEPLLKTWCCDMSQLQIICLRNIDCRRVNKHIENWLLDRQIIQKDTKTQLCVGLKVMFTQTTKATDEYSGVRNGEIAVIKNITRHETQKHIILKLSPSGKTVAIGTKTSQIPLSSVVLGYAITANKSQGSEWSHVLFWIYDDPNDFFTREFAYVAMSRSKKSCTVVDKTRGLQKMCVKKTPLRLTVLRYFIKEEHRVVV